MIFIVPPARAMKKFAFSRNNATFSQLTVGFAYPVLCDIGRQGKKVNLKTK